MLDKHKKEIFNHIEKNETQKFESFLQLHSNEAESADLLKLLNSKDSQGRTPLLIAVKSKHHKAIDLLIAQKVDLDEYCFLGNAFLDFFNSILNNGLKNVEYPALWQASFNSDLEIVKKLIQSGANKYLGRRPDNSPPFFAAAFNGDKDIVEFFIQSGVDVNFKLSETTDQNVFDTSMLTLAVGNGHFLLAEYLIQQGALIHFKTKTNNLPLQYAALKGNIAITGMLLDHGAGIGGTMPHLPYGLDTANKIVIGLKVNGRPVTRSTYGFEEAITTLEELQKAKNRRSSIPFIRDINVQDALGNTKLHRAVLSKHDEIFPVLFECGIDVKIMNHQGYTALHLLLDQEDFDPQIAINLIQRGADPNTKNKNGQTLLHLLAANTAKDITKSELIFHELIQLNVDPTIKDDDGKTYQDIYAESLEQTHQTIEPIKAELLIAAKDELFNIIKANRPDILTSFLRRFSEEDRIKLVNDQDKEDKTPLYIAASNGQVELIKLLIPAGAQVNKESTRFQTTPLWIAALKGHYGAAHVLLEAKADPNKFCKNENTPPVPAIFAATLSGSLPLVKLLVRHGVNSHFITGRNVNVSGETILLTLASEHGYLDIVHYLLQQKVDINYADEEGKTALYFAAQKGHASIISALIAHGAQIDPISEFKKDTPLCIATLHGHTKVVELLILAGANIHHQIDGNRPLAFIAAEEGLPEILQLLITAGINIHAYADNDLNKNLLHATSHNERFVKGLDEERKVRIRKNQPDAFQILIDAGAGISTRIQRVFPNTDFKHKLVIGLSVENISQKAVSRKDKGFEEAITTIDELKEVIQQGIDIPRKQWIDSCKQKLELEPENILVKEIIVTLYDYFPVNILNNQDTNGETALHFAIRHNPRIIPSLLIYHPNLALTNKSGHTALRVLLDQDNFDNDKVELAIALIRAGADVNTQNKDGNTLFHLMAYVSPDKLMPTASKLNADQTMVNQYNETCIDIINSIEENNKSIAHYKLSPANAAPHRSDAVKLAPKDSYAVFFNADRKAKLSMAYIPEIYSELTEIPADINFKNQVVIGVSINGKRVNRSMPGFEHAITNLDELKSAIKDNTPMPRQRLILACQNRLTAINRTFIKNSKEENELKELINLLTTGNTGLQLALNQNEFDLEAAMTLVRKKADPNMQNKDGKTILHLLAPIVVQDISKTQFVFELLSLGADQSIKDHAGKTWQDIKAECHAKGPQNMRQENIAIENNSSTETKEIKISTAEHISFFANKEEIIKDIDDNSVAFAAIGNDSL